MKFNVRSVLQDAESGLTFEEIMSKHGLSGDDLERLLAAKVKTDTFMVNKLNGYVQAKLSTRPESVLRNIYEARNIGDEDRRRVDRDLEELRRAEEEGVITAEEFHRRLKSIVRGLLTRKLMPAKSQQ